MNIHCKHYMLLGLSLLGACSTPHSSSPALSLFSDPSNTLRLSRSDQAAIEAGVQALNPYAGYLLAQTQAKTTPQTNDKNRQLLSEGMSMIEYRCGIYFDELGKALQALSFQRKETSLFGGLIQGSMGLANQSAKAIANTGALFGFATSSMDAYQEAFLYTPEIDSIRRLTFKMLANNAVQISESTAGKELSYGGAMSFLKQYESNCQPASIRALVNQAVIQATVSEDDGQLLVAIAGLATAVGEARISAEQAFALYWLQSDKYVEKSDANLLKEILKDIEAAFTNKNLDPVTAKNRTKAQFRFFPKATLEAWDKRIDEAHKPAPPSAKADSTAASNPTANPPALPSTPAIPAPSSSPNNSEVTSLPKTKFPLGTVAPTSNIIKR